MLSSDVTSDEKTCIPAFNSSGKPPLSSILSAFKERRHPSKFLAMNVSRSKTGGWRGEEAEITEMR